MLEAKNDNKDRNDIDITDNTSGTVGLSLIHISEPTRQVR